MALLPREVQQIRERLDNLEALPRLLDQIAHRDTLPPGDRSKVLDAKKAVESAVPWVRNVVNDDPFVSEDD